VSAEKFSAFLRNMLAEFSGIFLSFFDDLAVGSAIGRR